MVRHSEKGASHFRRETVHAVPSLGTHNTSNTVDARKSLGNRFKISSRTTINRKVELSPSEVNIQEKIIRQSRKIQTMTQIENEVQAEIVALQIAQADVTP